MRTSTNLYYFKLNQDTDLSENSEIVVNFTNGNWQIHSVFAVNGFSSPDTLQYSTSGNTVSLNNYGLASKEIQKIFAINLTST